MLLHNDLKVELGTLIQSALQKQGHEVPLEDIYKAISASPKIDVGHLAYPTFGLSKLLREKPPLIAKGIVDHFPENDLVQEINQAGPYLNFKLSTGAIGSMVCEPILDGRFFQKALTDETPKTMVEYSQPNTHKELHVGHMRNLALGESLILLHRYCGYEIVSATFPGDVGTHVAKCLWYMKFVNTETAPETRKGVWLGKMYARASLLLEDLKGTEEETAAKAIMTTILKQLEAGAGEYFDLWKETRAWSIAQMEEVYDWAGVEFDAWYWESTVDADSVKYAKENYEKGFFSESKGAIGIDLEEYHLGYAIVLKSDGNGAYLTKDLELARRKFQENGIEKSVYVVDKRQEQHFKQVFKILELMGFEQAENCHHLKYDYVELPDGPMSSRKGNIVPIMTLIEGMEAAIYENFLQAQIEKGEMKEAEAREIAAIVAKGAIKYGMVKIDTQKKIVFDLEQWIQISGNSGPYQQYVVARINSLLKKQGYEPEGQIDWSLLSLSSEIDLLIKVSVFNDAVLNATQKYQTNQVTNYLYDLSKSLNGFYNDVNIRDTEDPVLKNTRMALLDVVRKVETQGLALLGIAVPEKM